MIPITIITGFLGSGKTTLILNLLPQLPTPPSYRLALLKNEFGEVATDSLLTSSQSISGVQELLNGCICCNLVGQLSSALVDLARDYKPDRIIIETSGSAFPATLAMEVKRVAEESKYWDKHGKRVGEGEGGDGRGEWEGMGEPWFELDGVISVVDVENWSGYEDTSVTAKMQARYTDLIVLNKWELVSERRLEDVEDKILELEVDPPIPRTKTDKGWVDKNIIFGLDAKLASAEAGLGEERKHAHEHKEGEAHEHDHEHSSEVEVLSVTLTAKGGEELKGVDTAKLAQFLAQPTKDAVYRIKGILYASASTPPKSSDGSVNPAKTAAHIPSNGRAKYILNWAFGRWTFTPVPLSSAGTPSSSEKEEEEEEPVLKLTVVTAKYEANMFQKEIEGGGLVTLQGGAPGELTVKRVL